MAGSGCGADLEPKTREERSVLRVLLAINATMFVVEIVAGWLADSTGLIADSLDMLADATVYSVSLYAVGRSMVAKSRAAMLIGVLQVCLAVGVGVDVVRRAFVGSDPVSTPMMAIGGLALAANVTCLALLAKHREGEIHMRASWICSVTDVIANLGVIGGGLLVLLMGSRWPDLVVGAVITLVVLWGGLRIIREARSGRSGTPSCA